jgi:hypothetical protein
VRGKSRPAIFELIIFDDDFKNAAFQGASYAVRIATIDATIGHQADGVR